MESASFFAATWQLNLAIPTPIPQGVDGGQLVTPNDKFRYQETFFLVRLVMFQ
jgi:hypothetical protein